MRLEIHLCLVLYFAGIIYGKRKDTGGVRNCKKSLRGKNFWRISKKEVVSHNCQQKCTCIEEILKCKPLCPPSVTKDCQKYEIEKYQIPQTRCICNVKKCLNAKGSLDKSASTDNKHFTESLAFIIPLGIIGPAFILFIALFAFFKRERLKNKCCLPKTDKPEAQKSKWSIMLDKRPLPKLPPEAKRQEKPHGDELNSNIDDTTDGKTCANYGSYYSYPDLQPKDKSHNNPYEDLAINQNNGGLYEELPYEVYIHDLEVKNEPDNEPDNVYMEYNPPL